MRVTVVVFPGSNADFDALHALRDVVGVDTQTVFHREADAGVNPNGSLANIAGIYGGLNTRLAKEAA